MIINTLSPAECAHDMLDYEQQFGDTPYSALETLAEYYDELSEETGQPIEFDPVAWACDWAWYAVGDDTLRSDYGYLMPGDDYMDEDLLNELRNQTTVLDTDTGYWVQAF